MSDQRIDTGAEAATSTDADPGEGQGTADPGAHADPLDPQGLRASGDDAEMAQPTADGPGWRRERTAARTPRARARCRRRSGPPRPNSAASPTWAGGSRPVPAADQPPTASGSDSAGSRPAHAETGEVSAPPSAQRRAEEPGSMATEFGDRADSGRRTRSPGPRSRGSGGPRPARRPGSRRPGRAARAPAAGAPGAAARRSRQPAASGVTSWYAASSRDSSRQPKRSSMARSVSRWPPCAAGSTSQPRPPAHSTLPLHRSPCSRAGGSAGPASAGSRLPAGRRRPPRRRQPARVPQQPHVRLDPAARVEARPSSSLGRLSSGAAPIQPGRAAPKAGAPGRVQRGQLPAEPLHRRRPAPAVRGQPGQHQQLAVRRPSTSGTRRPAGRLGEPAQPGGLGGEEARPVRRPGASRRRPARRRGAAASVRR